jgi:hypothetical protein
MSKERGILRQLGLALVLAIGFGTLFGIAVAWGITIWDGLRARNIVAYESLIVGADGAGFGRVLIQRTSYSEYTNDVKHYGLDGGEVPAYNDEKNLTGVPVGLPHKDVMFRLDAYHRVTRFFDTYQSRPVSWYFVAEAARDSRGYFIGYDYRSMLPIGFIGRDGLQRDQPHVEQWFPVDGRMLASGNAFSQPGNFAGYRDQDFGEGFEPWKIEMLSGGRLLQVDLRTGSAKPLLESTDVISMGEFVTSSGSLAVEKVQPRRLLQAALEAVRFAVRTADHIIILDKSGKQHSAFVLPEELRDQSLTYYDLGTAMALTVTSHSHSDGSQLDELLWFDASGKVLRRAEVSLRNTGDERNRSIPWMSALMVPAPVIVAAVAMILPLNKPSDGEVSHYAAALTQSLAEFWPEILVVTLLAMALAWYCFRRQRRYYQPYGGAWFAFVLLAGIPGLVGYLFHRRWPVMEKCPACGHEVPRNRETCAKCGAAFPPPAPKGCEVFA